MIWNIIDITEISTVKYKEWEGQEGLLMWVRDIIGPYDLIATEFEKSFADGRIFCALTHHYLPQQFDYYSYNPRRKDLLQNALDLVSAQARVPQLLTAEDFSDKMDPISVIVYLYQWYYRLRN